MRCYQCGEALRPGETVLVGGTSFCDPCAAQYHSRFQNAITGGAMGGRQVLLLLAIVGLGVGVTLMLFLLLIGLAWFGQVRGF